MDYIHTIPGQPPVVVVLEKWRWEAVYDNGRVLKQFDDDGVFHRIAEVSTIGLKEFRMVTDGEQQVVQPYISGTKLIHFYRNTKLAVGTPNETNTRLYCFGYEQPDGTRIVQAIYPDGSVHSLEG